MNNELNLPPFYVGQKVVALRSVKTELNGIVKGTVYTVKELTQCTCGEWKVDVGLMVSKTGRCLCATCDSPYGVTGSRVIYVAAPLLAPVQENFQSISLEKVLEKETALISVN